MIDTRLRGNCRRLLWQREILLALAISFAASASASAENLAADCACGRVWRETLHSERSAWHAERVRLESELAAMRKGFNSDSRLSEGLGHDDVQAQSPSPQRGDRHIASHPGSPPALRLRSRTLLQTDPHCSIADLLAVQANPEAAVTALPTSNPVCAMCLVSCASAADGLSCSMGCLKQDDGVCTAEEVAALEAAGMPSSLADRAQLVRMLEIPTRACVRCIVETIASVCGDCLLERLHILTEYSYYPLPCLPELGARISVGEASAFERAVAANKPFGLTVGAREGSATMTDLFVPTAGPHTAYRGIDSGMLAYECDPAVHGRVWALRAAPSAAAGAAAADAVGSSATVMISDTKSWASCSGELRIELEFGEVHSQPTTADGSSRVPISFDLKSAACSEFLPLFDHIGPSADAKKLDGGGAGSPPTRAAACWLSRFFGPQTHWQGPARFAIELSGSSIALETDLVVRNGTTLRLASSARTTVVIGPHQIRVESGARLELEGLTLADSVQSSALVVLGSAMAVRTTFVHCNATTNIILSGVMDTLAPDGLGAFTAAVGAAVYIAPSASMEIVDSALLECSVEGGKLGNLGGAIFVGSDAQLLVLRSEFRRNSVKRGAFTGGGALFLEPGANATVRESIMDANVATGGSLLTAGGAVVLLNAQMILHKTDLSRNLASSAGEYAYGGGFYLYSYAQLAVSESLLCHNLVENTGAGSAGGGAITSFTRSLVNVTQTVLQSNAARGGAWSRGGSIYVDKFAALHLVQATFVGNYVDGARVSNQGGALFLDRGVKFRASDSYLRNNSAYGKAPQGGAIFSSAESTVLVNTSLLQNRVVVSNGVGEGGAISVLAGFHHLIRSRLHDNIAESLYGSANAKGGAIFVSSGITRIEGSSLHGNRMGGVGMTQVEVSANVGGAHVLAEGGDIILDGCSVADVYGTGNEARMENAADWWLAALQSLVLHNSSFRSATPYQALLRIQGLQLQLLIRGCTFENVTIDVPDRASVQPIGVLDSTFAPALNPAIPTVQPTKGSGDCAVQLAGERVCDPRALCKAVPSGGVRCFCVGEGLEGLRYKLGVPEDGRQCEQDPSLHAVLESDSIRIIVPKPGESSGEIRLHISALGERDFNSSYRVTTSLLPFGATEGRLDAISHGPLGSAFGSSFRWSNPVPASNEVFVLQQKFESTIEREFKVMLRCNASTSNCSQDGDILETIISLEASVDLAKPSFVKIVTEVQAIPSCNQTRALIVLPPGGVFSGQFDTVLRVDAWLFDVDGLAITKSSPVISVRCSNNTANPAIARMRPISLQRQDKASNLFSADVLQQARSVPGLYQLTAVLRDGWDESSDRQVSECTLATWVVEVQDATQSQLQSVVALGISAAGCLVLVAMLVCLIKMQGDRFQHIFSMVVFEISKLIIAWTFEIADIATDTIAFLRAVVVDSVRAEYTLPTGYKIAYSCFFGIAIIVSAIALIDRSRHCTLFLRASQKHDDSNAGRISTRLTAGDDDDRKFEELQSKLRWEVDKSKRELRSNMVTLLTVLLEDIPFIIINGALPQGLRLAE